MPTDVIVEAGGSALASHLTETGDCLLGLLDLHESELTVSLVDDAIIRDLNAKWRERDRPTDVLSFPQLDEGEEPPRGVALLGDVVISVETADEQARAGGWTLEEETARLLLHGLLHLLGFDHEDGGEQAARMQAEERRLAARLHELGIACAAESLATPGDGNA